MKVIAEMTVIFTNFRLIGDKVSIYPVLFGPNYCGYFAVYTNNVAIG